MKKIILASLAFLLITSSAAAFTVSGRPAPGVAAGTTAYCTGATTCTATTPGSCEIMCEDFEGSTSCFTGYDSNCRATASSVSVASGDAIDFTTAHAGTPSCTDKGSNAVQITVTAGTHDTLGRWTWGSDQTVTYGQFYFQLSSITLADVSRQTIAEVANNSGTAAFDINILRTGANYYFDVTSSGMTTLQSTTTISTGTWYRIGWAANETDDTFKLYINGTQEGGTKTNFTTSTAMRRFYFGNANGYKSATALVSQYDNIAISATAQPGACNE